MIDVMRNVFNLYELQRRKKYMVEHSDKNYHNVEDKMKNAKNVNTFRKYKYVMPLEFTVNND